MEKTQGGHQETDDRLGSGNGEAPGNVLRSRLGMEGGAGVEVVLTESCHPQRWPSPQVPPGPPTSGCHGALSLCVLVGRGSFLSPQSMAPPPCSLPGAPVPGVEKAPGTSPMFLGKGGAPLLRPHSLIHEPGTLPGRHPRAGRSTAQRISQASGSDNGLIARVNWRRNSPEGRVIAIHPDAMHTAGAGAR